MRICFLVDARSPIAQNWIRYFEARGDEVHIISSFPCPPDTLSAVSFSVVPVAFSGFIRRQKESSAKNPTAFSEQFAKTKLRPIVSWVRHWLGPLDVLRQAKKVRSIVEGMEPDLVHAMRIPFEGALAAAALKKARVPLLVSVWGNDFTLHAPQSPFASRMTRSTMARADALHPDCYRDLRLAASYGFSDTKPAIVLPSGGGVQRSLFHPGSADRSSVRRWDVPEDVPVVLNPRGFCKYVRSDVFFRSIPLVLEKKSETVFLALKMKGNPVAEGWVHRLGLRDNVRLLPSVNREHIADLFRLADITISPSEHDGTPNTLLEGIACGAFPVVGDIESVREWIVNGKNGLLCDPADPRSLAKAIIKAIEDNQLREEAARVNQEIIRKRAEYERVMVKARDFYRDVAHGIQSRKQTAELPNTLVVAKEPGRSSRI